METFENGRGTPTPESNERAKAQVTEQVETATLSVHPFYAKVYQHPDEEAIKLLSQQIEENITLGMPEPVVYVNDILQVLDGFNVWLAIQLLGWKSIKVIALHFDEDTEKEAIIKFKSRINLEEKSWVEKANEIGALELIYKKKPGPKVAGAEVEYDERSSRARIALITNMKQWMIQQIQYLTEHYPALLEYLDEKGGKLSKVYGLANAAKDKGDMGVLSYFINDAITYEQAMKYSKSKRTCVKKERKSTKLVDRKPIHNSCPLWGKPECLGHLTKVIYNKQPNTNESLTLKTNQNEN